MKTLERGSGENFLSRQKGKVNRVPREGVSGLKGGRKSLGKKREISNSLSDQGGRAILTTTRRGGEMKKRPRIVTAVRRSFGKAGKLLMSWKKKVQGRRGLSTGGKTESKGRKFQTKKKKRQWGEHKKKEET